MRKALILLIVFILLLIVPFAARYMQYYTVGGSQAQPPPIFDPAKIALIATPPASEFKDEPIMDPANLSGGLVLLDQAHDNQFRLEEINFLDGRLAARNFEMSQFTDGDLAAALRPVNAFIVITPIVDFTADEIRAVSDFVERGGRLLLIGDPTRFGVTFNEDEFFGFTVEIDKNQIPLNRLANEFGLVFNGDYLYNTIENEGNFRNIILKSDGFGDDTLVEGLDQLALYSSQSLELSAGGTAVLTADDNTWSSATDRPGGLVLAATGGNGRVLALGDIHFLTNPYHTVYDNSEFITRIADFLTDAENRTPTLVDFPYFFDSPTNLVFTGSPEIGAGAFNEIIDLQSAMRQVGKTLNLADAPQKGADTVYVGLYNQAEEVADILAAHGITLVIEPPLEADPTPTPEPTAVNENEEPNPEDNTEEATQLILSDLGNVFMSGSALILLDQQDESRTLIVLAASGAGLKNSMQRLIDLVPVNAESATADCLLQGDLAICPTNINDEVVEAELDTRNLTVEDEVIPSTTGSDAAEELDAVYQGSISLDESVTGILEAAERHAWTFDAGPVVIDIQAESEALDLVLEVYDSNNILLDSSDNAIGAGGETIFGVDVPESETVTIVIYDYLDETGTYTLTVTTSEFSDIGSGNNIFIFADDDGEPLTSGFTNALEITDILAPDYAVTVWSAQADGPLEFGQLDPYDLVIWDSGDYQMTDTLLDEDTLVIFDYLDNNGNLMAIGAAPTLLGTTELALTSDLEVSGEDAVLLDGLTVGEVIPLVESIETAVFDFTPADTADENVTVFLTRGPESAASGQPIGIASAENSLSGQATQLLLIPFGILPADYQNILLSNMMAWFAENG